MNHILAQYLFNKETLYKNPQTGIDSEKEIVAEKKETSSAEETPEVFSTPKVAPTPPPVLVAEAPKPVVPVTIPLKLNHKVLVISEVISEDEKGLLSKILRAVGLSLAQIDLIEIQKTQQIDYPSFIEQKITAKFISFGVGLSKLNWDLMLVPYEIRTVSGIDFLLAHDLGVIAADTKLKKDLWAALQKMFNK
ncbi:DNA polymerase III subunit psi [Emticicia sp. BO119]|uniref:DNA polymerase III subunit psi n=1 Tax=Emticicia sp. BO119 TaxID=2757768 RepID=UPI0015F12105|nr:DNA polymerase III subunit psi [Emticicia sp. BO119]MBA4852600.1 DNA polymerase III subunit psi [Emticicia sp. BO119]